MKNKTGRYVACMDERISAYKVLVEKPEGKRPHGRPRCRGGASTKMVLQDRKGQHGLDLYGSR